MTHPSPDFADQTPNRPSLLPQALPHHTSVPTPKAAEIIAAAYLSTHLTGHAGYIHGGLLGVLFDDAYARFAVDMFPSRIGNWSLDFRAPAVPGRVYVWRVGVEKFKKERKVWVNGVMRCSDEFGAEEMLGRIVG